MSETIRIKTTPNGGDNYIKIKLESDFDFIEILSLKISQEDTYKKYCSDYGVIVGRVNVNNGFGVPNAKVSVFIPLDDIDKNNPLISGLYPYEVVTDKNSDGIRYNLLPKDGDTTNDCSTPIGSFPNKREVLDNEVMRDIYCKYYKFTTTTNHAGDYMIFGVPVGNHIVHVDADISDIGIISQRPYDLINQGTPTKFFNSPTKFKEGNNLDKLVQVKSLNSGINVQPFWGDIENCEIGISRLDFDLNHTIIPSAIFMGSIYGDQDKHSINYRCQPRKKLGDLCEQVTGSGSIEMIRKVIDNSDTNINGYSIEEFSVEGGRVIDENGSWAFQIPMNLDYMVTSEDGTLVLTNEPNTGIPTRASVRFKIGMDETGGEGRLRTRARYLVPNNPSSQSEIDYNFDKTTKPESFADLYWNKIYSVKNYIPRYQTNNNSESRRMTGIKNVDNCSGVKNPFPYNRVDTETNPIFFIICLIIKILAFLIFMLNSFVIPLINVIIKSINTVIGSIVGAINRVIRAINSVERILHLNLEELSWTEIEYIGCVTVECPNESPSTFAPGCKKDNGGNTGGIDNGKAWRRANDEKGITYYFNDGFLNHDKLGNGAGLDECLAFEMAKTLNMFQFDFYNDWVNGSLFSVLLKYKKKRDKTKNNGDVTARGREKFCEYDCDDFSGGVDNNENGNPDNNCHNQFLVDNFINGGVDDNDWQKSSDNSGIIREGLIKKVGDEFYYAATTHSGNFKLFATDIINLGSIFSCDWQGLPKIHDMLIPSSYKIPPDINEVLDEEAGQIYMCGMVNVGTPKDVSDGNTEGGLFFSIDCIGLHVNKRQSLNIRHICEMGVETDSAVENDGTGDLISNADCTIGSEDIDGDGKSFRDSFYGLNYPTIPTTPPINGGYSTNFNINNVSADSGYNFVSNLDNGSDYVNYRGYSINNVSVSDTSFGNTKNSYFFYFGLIPGFTALDRLNSNYITPCKKIIKDEILIVATTSPTETGVSTGSISLSMIGGTAPYSYTINGTQGTIYGPTSGVLETEFSIDLINSLAEGTYLIDGFDALGTPASQIVSVSGPPSLYFSAQVNTPVTAVGANNGTILITSVGGGSGSGYQYKIYNSVGTLIEGPLNIVIPESIENLSIDTYSIIVNDNDGNIKEITGFTINGPTNMVAAPIKTDVTCYGGNNGTLSFNITGGQPPYSYLTTAATIFPPFISNAGSFDSLRADTYTTTVIDNNSSTLILNNTISQPTPLIMLLLNPFSTEKQCSTTEYRIPFNFINGLSPSQLDGTTPINVVYKGDHPAFPVPTTVAVTYNAIENYIMVPASHVIFKVDVWFVNDIGCISNIVSYLESYMVLPTVEMSAGNNTSTAAGCVVGVGEIITYIDFDEDKGPITLYYQQSNGDWVSQSTRNNVGNYIFSGTNMDTNVNIKLIDKDGCEKITTTPLLVNVRTVPMSLIHNLPGQDSYTVSNTINVNLTVDLDWDGIRGPYVITFDITGPSGYSAFSSSNVDSPWMFGQTFIQDLYVPSAGTYNIIAKTIDNKGCESNIETWSVVKPA